MKIRSSFMTARSSIIAAISLIVLALLLVRNTNQGSPSKESPRRSVKAEPAKLRSTSRRSDPTPSITQVMRMGESDLKRLLDEDYAHLNEADRLDALELAAELDHSLSTGGDTHDPEAEIFAEAILVLLQKDEETLARGIALPP